MPLTKFVHVQARLSGAALTGEWLPGVLRMPSGRLPHAGKHVPAVWPGICRLGLVPALPDRHQHLCW